MIADFRTSPLGEADTVYVELLWQGNLRQGRLHVSSELRQALALQGYPEFNTGPMGVPFALSSGVFLAMISGLKCRVTGDLSAWDKSWGNLEPAEPQDWGL